MTDMECGCDKHRLTNAKIRHVYGNVLRIAVPLTKRTLVKDGDEVIVTDTDFIPSSDHPVWVVFSKGKTNYPIIATMDGNVAIIEDKGKIPVGTYDISVECYDGLGNPYRFKQKAVLYVTDTTAEAGIDEEIEYEAQTWYLNAAVFLATTEIGEIGDSYYKKDEVDSLVSRTEEGLRFDFSQELPLVVPVTKNGNSITSTVDFSAIDNAIREDGRLVVACVNDSEFYQLLDANRAEVSFSQVNALDGYQVLLIVDTHNVWSMEDVDLGTGGGGGGYEPPAGGIPKTDLAPAVQASLDKADTALQQSDLSGYATTDDVDNAVATLVSSAPQTLDTLKELADALGDDPNFATTMATQLGNKVDKETGKGLSTNDYTTAEKTKLAGIAAGAEVNVQADWSQTNTSADDYIKNKPTIPDTSILATKTELNAKQDKINDLATIRSGAAAGATAYQKPTGGIPASDIASGVIPDTSGFVTTSAMNTALAGKQNTLTFDSTPTTSSTNPVTSGGVKTYVDGKASITGITTSQDGTFTIALSDGNSYTVNLNHVHSQYVESDDLADVALSGSYNDLTDKPVIPEGADLSGYYTKTEIDNKGFITTETDPTVPSWAKQSSKPTYTAQEVGALPASTTIPTKVSDLTNDSGFITSYTETDPTVPAWAKSATKPSYTASEVGAVPTTRKVNGKALSADISLGAGDVGALPSNTHIPADQVQSNWNETNTSSKAYIQNKPTIPAAQVNADWNATSGVSRILNKPTIPTVPTKVSSFSNDAGYLTQHQSLANYYTKSEIDTKIGNIETLLASI